MYQSKYEWHIREKLGTIDRVDIERFKLTDFETAILEHRGFTNTDDLTSVLKPNLYDVNLMENISIAAKKIQDAIDYNKRILIYGDFDADGITSTFLMYRALKSKLEHISWFIPDRIYQGYGPNQEYFEESVVGFFDLVIFVDNGVGGKNEIEYLTNNNIDVIIIDHHEIIDPPNVTLIHPQLGDNPFKSLAGVGTVYKVLEYMNLTSDDCLAYVAIGTVADLVPLVGENKYLVTKGLEILNSHPPKSIHQLLKVAGHQSIIDEETIGFTIAPRLNATGRMEGAELAMDLLLSEDEDMQFDMASYIDQLNQDRKSLVQKTFLEATEQVDDNNVIIVYNDKWHHGILGIVASKLTEAYGKPAIVLSRAVDDDYFKGSSRSIDGVDFLSIVKSSEFYKNVGGHAHAFGIEVEENDINNLKQDLNQYVSSLNRELKPIKYIDYELKPNNINVNTYEKFMRLKPFGQTFKSPVVIANNVNIGEIRQVGKDKNHLKMTIPELELNVIGFNFGHLIHEVGSQDTISMIGTLNINTFNNTRTLQLMLEDVAIDHVQIIDMRSKLNQDFSQIRKDDIFLIQNSKKKRGSNYFYYGEELPYLTERIVLRDLPENLNDLKKSLSGVHVSKIIIIFNQNDELYFKGIPNITHVEKAWDMIKNAKDESIDLKIHAPYLAKRLNISMHILKLITDILVNLNHIQLNNGIIKLLDLNEVNVNDSSVYQRFKQILESEKLLKMSDSTTLKVTLKDIINE